jgi:HSP20 family protein
MARNSLIPLGGMFRSDPIFSLHREMNRLFDDLVGGQGMQASQSAGLASAVSAHMNVSESDKDIRVSVELPGVTEQDIDVSLDDDLLTIRGEKKFEQERGDEKQNYHYLERSYGSFQRSLRLPFKAKPEEVQADFHNGVLTVTVPKSAQQQQSHRIQVQAGPAKVGQSAQTGEAAQSAKTGKTGEAGERNEEAASQSRGRDQPGGEQAAAH